MHNRKDKTMIIILGLILLLPGICYAAAEIPSGYFQLPIWALVTLLGMLTGFISYVWHRMEKAVDKNESSIDKVKDLLKINGDNDAKRDESIKVLETRLNTVDSQTCKKDEIARDFIEKFTKADQQILINTGRLDKLIADWDSASREELSRGGYVTMDKFSEVSQKLASDLTKMFSEKVETLEKNLSLQLENMRLSIIANGKAGRKAARKQN
jgi:hypothetical protein